MSRHRKVNNPAASFNANLAAEKILPLFRDTFPAWLAGFRQIYILFK